MATLVVVDDCVLSGARTREFLADINHSRVVLAHLYSHPDARAAIVAQDPRVHACVSARDLCDHGPARHSDMYTFQQKRWLERMGDRYYWTGEIDSLFFAWGEPERTLWNSMTERLERGWALLPLSRCIKHRRHFEPDLIPLQLQREGRGRLRPAETVMFGEMGEEPLLGDIETMTCFGISGVAGAIWHSIVEYGDKDAVFHHLSRCYEVIDQMLRRDLDTFIGDLLDKGLLIEADDGPDATG